MAKKSATERNAKRKRMARQYAPKRAKLKAVIMDKDSSMEERFQAQVALSELPRNSAKNRIRNRCGVTGRPRGFYRKLKMSRIALRDLASSGEIPGMIKSSW